jgi:AhpD family alkylhydroperoxidase
MENHSRYSALAPPNEPQGELATLYQQFRQELGLIPEPLTLHAPSPTLLVSFWGAFRSSMLVGTAPRGAKETVAAAISDANRCIWCVDAHTTMLYATKNRNIAEAILYGGTRSQLSQNMNALLDWSYATCDPEASILAHPPFPAEQAGEFLGTALIFHYINRMVSVFLSETFLPTTPWLQGATRRLGGKKFASTVQQTFVASEFEGASSLPIELYWMAQWPTIAQAFAIWDATVEDLGTQALPLPVRELLDRKVNEWDGRNPGLSRKWVEDTIASLTTEQRSIGRVMLLAALAPNQMDASTMQKYLDLQPDSGLVISAVAWACWRATRRIGSWLYPLKEPFMSDLKSIVLE